jgi:hypothetical protein
LLLVFEVAMRSRSITLACGLLLLALGGCDTAKSSNPTAPTVAGPIAGVEISAPGMVSPGQGTKFKENEQPITLTIQNSTTTGVRTLSYSFEVATDTGFGTKVFARSSVTANPGGKTSVQLDRLPIGQAYFWRARAEDGANTGPFGTSGFEIFPKAAINPPTPVSPINGAVTASSSATLVTNNVSTVGPVGHLGYNFQVSLDQTFAKLIAGGIVPEGAGQTTLAIALPASSMIFWRVSASDSETAGPWSIVQAFKTPGAPAPPPPGGGGGGGSGPVGNCDSLVSNKPALVQCIRDSLPSPPTNEVEAFEVTKRVAWALRGEGAGLLIKNGGENIVLWQGYSFSASRICYPDGHIYKVISDAGPGGANGATWSDNDFVDKSLYVPAIDPSKK